MGDKTGISWCDHTYNIWIGCTKVSEGCKLCYAERENKRLQWTKLWGPQGERHRTTTQPMLMAWDRHYWKECGACGWRGESDLFPECPECNSPALRPTRQRVFVNSLSDLFEDQAELVPWRNEFWALTQICTGLDFLLLTKRPENIDRLSPREWREQGWPSNIWLGISAEDQFQAEKRIRRLVRVPAAVRWISVEPMLGPVRLPAEYLSGASRLSWIVCGGESGPGCRPMQTSWARILMAQCQAFGMPFYMKQLGGAFDRREQLQDLPRDLQIRQWPEAAAARSVGGG